MSYLKLFLILTISLPILLLMSCSKEIDFKEKFMGKWENENKQIEFTNNEIIQVSAGGAKFIYKFDPKEADLLNEGKVIWFNNEKWYLVFNEDYSILTFTKHGGAQEYILKKVKEFSKIEPKKQEILEAKLIPVSATIGGNLSDKIEIVQDAPHKLLSSKENLLGKNINFEMKVKVKVLNGNNDANFDWDDFQLSVEFFDSNDSPISGIPVFSDFKYPEGRSKLCGVLNSKTGEEAWISIYGNINPPQIPSNLTKFSLSINYQKNIYGGN